MLIDGRKTEVSSAQASGMEETFQALQIKEVSARNLCYKCEFPFSHKSLPCPAKEAICSNCSVKGHFAKVFRKTQSSPQMKHHSCTPNQDQTPEKPHYRREFWKSHKTHQIYNSPANESSSSDDTYGYTLEEERTHSTHKTFLPLNDSTVKYLVDAGVTVDIIDDPAFQVLKKSNLSQGNGNCLFMVHQRP